ncbi:MAG: hypothetical protein HZA50_14950 [Planctomycetes bacterium]|nr:hypothetical protein [Planctomycetota bacterium]
MTSTLTDIADAVVEELNAGSFSPPFTAQRLNLPEFDLAEMDSLHVTVVPKVFRESRLSRGAVQNDYSIDVGVMKRFVDQPDQDAMLALVEQIKSFFRGRRLSGYSSAICVGAENDPPYDPTHLSKLRQFTSVLTLTFRIMG